MSELRRRAKRRVVAGATAATAVLSTLAATSGLVPGARASTLPTTSTRWQTCAVTLNGVPVTVDQADRTRTVVNGTEGSWARLGFYVRTDSACGFERVLMVDSRVGYHGITDGATRRQGTGTTPAGTYTMTQAFGNSRRPATAMPYHRVQPGDWWVEDNASLFYNELRNADLGGFLLRTTGTNSSELLAEFPTQYAHAIVINFNRAPDRKVLGRGAGIFLHVNGTGATAGCVSISLTSLRTLLSYLEPGNSITITA